MGKLRIALRETPKYRLLLSCDKTATASVGKKSREREFWYAANDEREFISGGPIALLGIVYLYESRGENWIAMDEEIEVFMREYGN